ncbi:MAG: tetratricopeptide repeat protein [Betaproteobacteria bacterium]
MSGGLAWWLERKWLAAQASLAVLLGLKSRAQALYARIVARAPGDLVARATLGNMLMEQGQGEAAIGQFEALLRAHPEHADSWFNLGFIQEKFDRVEAAEQSFRRALALNAKHDRAWYGLGLVLIRQGRLREAVAALKKNTELQPFSPYGFYQLAMTHHHLGEDAEAWRLQRHLQSFEPKFAAGLKRDLEQTPVQSRNAEAALSAPVLPTSSAATHAL